MRNAPPTLEQCERAAVALGFPILAPGLQPPYYEESMRHLHALIQKSINGDEQAAKTLHHLRERFT